MNKLRSHDGFSLVEVLIAILVFGTGVLGMAGLQMKSLSMLSNSHSVNVATIAISDMADRMRANPIGVDRGHYDNLAGEFENPNCGANCSIAELAQFDAFAVRSQLVGELVAPTLSVTNVGNNLYTIEVTWSEKSASVLETKTQRSSVFMLR